MTADPGDARRRPVEVGGRRCAVLGSPIRHSLSPVLHRAAYAELGLSDWQYDRFELTAPDLAGFVAGLDRRWRGLSLTMPLKEAALELGAVDPLAALAGAGNTAVLDADGARVYNTDIDGLVWAVRRLGVDTIDSATLLGAGATARSATISLARLGARRITVLARTAARAQPLASLGGDLGLAVDVRPWGGSVPRSDLVVATTPAGGADELAAATAASAPVVFDVVYDPWPTVLAAAAERAGAQVGGGLDLLVGQALLQIELMTGRTVPAEVLYRAGRAALAARGHAG